MVAMSGWFAKVVLFVGFGLVALSAAGTLFFYEAPGRDVRLVLVGGGDLPGGTVARLRLATGGATTETSLRVRGRTDDGPLLRLPQATAPALAEIVLLHDDAVLWRTALFLDAPLPAPAKDAPPPEPQILTADPAALLPLIDGSFDCDAGAVQTVAIDRAADGMALIADIDGQTHPILSDGDGWTAGNLRLMPVDGALLLRDAKHQAQFCQPGVPPDLRGLRLSGPDWTLVLQDHKIGWAVAGASPAVFSASGTLTQKTMRLLADPHIDSIDFRSNDPAAPSITATPASCAAQTSDTPRDWQITIRAGDGWERGPCSPGSPYPLPALYRQKREPAAVLPKDFILNGRTFAVQSACFSYAG